MARVRSSVDLARQFQRLMHTKNHLFSLAIGFLLAIGGFGCRNMVGQVTATQPDNARMKGDSFALTPIYMPDDSSDVAYRSLPVRSIRQFFGDRDNTLFWTFDHQPTVQADSVIAFIRNVGYYGLPPGAYHHAEIEALCGNLAVPENIFRFEALLTAAYVSLVQHVWRGKTTATTATLDSVAVSLLQDASINGGLVRNIIRNEPSSTGYRHLKHGLSVLLDSLAERRRQDTISRSVTVSQEMVDKLKTIEVNLERWRLEEKPFGARYIFINIPEFMLYVIEHDSVVLASKIIVGTFDNQTPELSSVVECFVTYPYWHVPRKIAVEEYLPFIQKDTSFLSRNNFDVLDRKGKVINADSLEWKTFSTNYFPVRLRQREGSENALGVIKFMFDNPYSVFLHDTNAKKLFLSRVRAFSHGCVRMEKAVELAHYLVTGDVSRKSRYVERFLKEESRHTVDLQKPIPIYIRYYTCEFKGHSFLVYHDLYAKDDRLYEALHADALDLRNGNSRNHDTGQVPK